MSNMSYCRFHNTRLDLGDCLRALDSDENQYPISEEEIRSGISMFKMFLDFCVENVIIERYDKESIPQIFKEHNDNTE